MQVFREVCRHGSFSAAAESLELANSAVSRQVTELEKWLGVKLLYRTTRTLSLTDDGRIYLEKIEAILGGVRALEQQASSSQIEVHGTLNITAPLFLGRHILEPMLSGFLKRYPAVNVSLLLVDRFVDLVAEGFDLALRVGVLQESNLMARQLDNMRLKAVAAPEYLEKYSVPNSPQDLSKHNCLYDSVARQNHRWHFSSKDGEIITPVEGNLTINDGEMVVQMAVDALGVAYLPDFFVDDLISAGKLVPVLDDYTKDAYPVSIIYPHNRHMNLTLRTFIDSLFEYYSNHIKR